MMKKTNVFVLLAILLSLVTIGSCTSSGPVVQLINYRIIPENIYPGVIGQLELTLYNSGSEIAKGTTVYYTYGNNDNWNLYVGDMGADSETITTIPFRVPDKVDSGIVIVTLDIYYLDEGGTSSLHSMSSIPIQISQHQILEVKTLSISQDTVRKGDKLSVGLEILNSGGVMKNVIISTQDNSSFRIDGTTQQWVGDISANSSKNISVMLSSSSSAEEGRYTIPLTITYYDILQNEVSQIIQVGPITLADSSSLFRISAQPVSSSEIGSELVLNITLENKGNNLQSATLTINDNDIFTPVGTDTIYFDNVQPEEKRSEIINLGIDASSSSGYYVLPMTLKTNGDEVPYSSGIFVQATPSLILTSETEQSDTGLDTTIKIANSGNTAIRSLFVYAEPTSILEVIGTKEKFIGTLNVDDFASFSITVKPKQQSGQYKIPIVIQFKDNDNIEHTMRQDVDVQLQTGISAASDSFASRQRPGGSGFPVPSFVLYIGGGILLVVLGYFGYKKYVKRGVKQ